MHRKQLSLSDLLMRKQRSKEAKGHTLDLSRQFQTVIYIIKEKVQSALRYTKKSFSEREERGMEGRGGKGRGGSLSI